MDKKIKDRFDSFWGTNKKYIPKTDYNTKLRKQKKLELFHSRRFNTSITKPIYDSQAMSSGTQKDEID